MSDMSNDTTSSVPAPAVKAITALLAGFGVSSWSDFAALAAATYTMLLITEWFWKKFWRPFLEARGILKRNRRRREDLD